MKKKVSTVPDIDTKKIGSFLKSINETEYIYMRHCMGMRDSIQSLINRHELTKEDFCKRFQIKPEKYRDYTIGNYNYSMHDMALLNAVFMELETEKLKDQVPAQVVKTPRK